jgi:hypothetical protein
MVDHGSTTAALCYKVEKKNYACKYISMDQWI